MCHRHKKLTLILKAISRAYSDDNFLPIFMLLYSMGEKELKE
jgi:hypothetical protein